MTIYVRPNRPGARWHLIVTPTLLMLAGCPEAPLANPVYKDTPDLIAEGLTEEQADAIGADSVDLPSNLTGVVYNGIALGAPPPPAKSRSGTADAKDAPVPKFIAAMLARGSELGETPWNVGEGTSMIVQNWGLSYVYGSKDPYTLPPVGARCRDLGLDCSGFIGECVRAGGIPLYSALGTEALGNPKTYNDKIPPAWSATMVYINGKPADWMTGDMIIWKNHQGIVVQRENGTFNLESEDTIWNCAGSANNPCEKNRGKVISDKGVEVKRGPAAWPLEKYNVYNKDFEGVLRLYDKPTVTISATEDRSSGSTQLTLSASVTFPGKSGGWVPEHVRLYWQSEGEGPVAIGVNAEAVTLSPSVDGLKAVSTVPVQVYADGQSPTPVSLTLRDPDANNAKIGSWHTTFTVALDENCDASAFAGANMYTVVENGRNRSVFKFTNTHPYRKILINFYTEVDPAPDQTCGDAAGVNTNGELIHSWYLELGPGGSYDGKGKLGGYGGCEGGTYPGCGHLTPQHVLGYRYWARYEECEQNRQDDRTVYATMPGATSVFPCSP